MTTLFLTRAYDWRDDSACRDEDPELHFPLGKGEEARRQMEQAKAVCARCPVTDQCLQWAMETRQEDGVWGGMSEDERFALRGRQRGRRRLDGLTATEHIMRNRLTELRELEGRGLDAHAIAQQLGTNAQTINRVRARLAEQAAQAARGVNAA